jgi:hypothetical protein
MQQRRLRLGDILDDYCPRERRVTNHAVVAMVGDDVKQTRCTTCDAEHEFKQGRVPTLRRKKDAVSAAYNEVLANAKGDLPPQPAGGGPTASRAAAAPAAPQDQAAEPEPLERDDDPETAENGSAESAEGEEGRVHRRLIRATLPRPENQQVTRPVPEFTMRQPTGGRSGKFRGPFARPAGPRPAGAGRGAGHPGGGGRSQGFGRSAGGRGGNQGGRASGRNDIQRPSREGHGGRPPKKRSK